MAPTAPLKSKRRVATDALEKDETELRLEKALFGDDAGFLQALKTPTAAAGEYALQRIRHGSNEESVLDGENEELGDVPDEDLFFLDAGTGELPESIARDLAADTEKDVVPQREPTWMDSDDDRITVSLANNTRLRKLRETEEDDVVDGREYIRRLRRQYERLHPTPEWVAYARKRKRTSTTLGDEEDTDSDISMDDSLPTAQPLAELLRTAGSLTRTDASSSANKRRKLRPEVLDIQRTKDIAAQGPSSIDVLQFHPYYPLLLSAGPSSTINLYHISPHPPNPNPLLTSLHMKNTPLHTVAFCTPTPTSTIPTDQDQDPTRVVLSSRRRYFHTWALSTGSITKTTRSVPANSRHDLRSMESFSLAPDSTYIAFRGTSKKGGGSVHILSTATMQWISSCRIDSRGGLASFAWWADSTGLSIVGKNGEVSEYSVTMKRVLARWHDEGAVGTTVITLGGSSPQSLGCSRWVAIGSSSGIVNIYDRHSWSPTSTSASTSTTSTNTTAPSSEPSIPLRPKPTRVLDQLTTPISHLTFSSDGQMLVLSSRWKKNALRLVHLPSCTVYRNWPTDKTPLGRVSAVALSTDGAYLAVGNEQGKIRLWEIRD